MPAPGEGRRPRKGHYSCNFCRLRKLRCDRPIPCTNCVSRGKQCLFESEFNSQGDIAPRTAASPAHAAQQKQGLSAAPALPTPLPHKAAVEQAGLLAEVQALRKLAQDLESRVIQSTSYLDRHNGDLALPASTSSPLSSRADSASTPSSSVNPVSEVMAHLERVSMGQISQDPLYVDDLVFKIGHMRDIPQTPTYTAQAGISTTRCVWLPRREEAMLLIDKYVANIGYIHHVVHHPSLPKIVDDVYRQISDQEPIQPGHIVLLLSIIASVTYVWVPEEGADGEDALLSASQASIQTTMWIKATHDVLSVVQNSAPVSLETVQGIIILSFIIFNLESLSLRYQSLVSTGLLLSRELGLHRIDHGSNATAANTIQAEMGRRAWWYLAATDWLMAARYGGPSEGVYQVNPRQMMVKKPRNINDFDLVENSSHLGLSDFQPTEMSYFLQRVRLAEISRTIVDHTLLGVAGSEGPSPHTYSMAINVELDHMMRHIPSFFRMENFERESDTESNGIFIQAYMLNSIIHTQRCRLHLTYLKSGIKKDPGYASSRETCLNAARQIIRAEKQLERAQHPFVLIRLKLSAILYGVFLASIVLLMDACVNGGGLQQDEIRNGEVAEALQIIEDARAYSLAAANLHDSLTKVLNRHRAQQQQQQQQQQQNELSSTSVRLESTFNPPDLNTMAFTQHRPNLSALETNAGVVQGGSVDSIQKQLPATSQLPPGNQLAENLEELMALDNFHWGDLFSSMGPSSFF